MSKLKIISGAEARRLVNMAQAIQAVKEAYIQLSQGNTVIPLRTSVEVKKHSGVSLFMPAYLESKQALGAKIISIFPENKKKKLPTIHALVVYLNAKTGKPEAVMDGTYLTALRTGAGSGVATDLLARPDSKTAAIFGAGVQARTQLLAVCTVRKIQKVWVYDCQAETLHNYIQEMKNYGPPLPEQILPADSPSQAVQGADIICTATTSSTPVFEDKDLKPGVHINAIGSFSPDIQEIPSETVVRSQLYVDSISACLEETGDLILPLNQGLIKKEHIKGEIGEVAAGKIPSRQSNHELTLFKAVGVAVQDTGIARLIFQKAQQKGLGQDLEI